MTFQGTALLLAWVAIVLLAFAMSGLLRQIYALSAQRGTSGTAVIGPSPGSSVRDLLGLLGGEPRATALFFVDTHCEACSELLPELDRLATVQSDVRVAAVFREGAAGYGDAAFSVLEAQEPLFRRLSVSATPFGLLATADGTVTASQPIGSSSQLRDFTSTFGRDYEPAR